MMDPEDRVKGRDRDASHMASARVVTAEASHIHVIVVVETLDGASVVLENLVGVWVGAFDHDASRGEGKKVAVTSLFDHGQASPHFILSDLIEVVVHG